MERNATSSTSAIEVDDVRCFWTFRVGGQLKEPLGECSPESDASKADISMQRNGSSIALLHVFSKRLSVELMPTFSLSLSVAHVDHPDFIHGASFFHRMNENTHLSLSSEVHTRKLPLRVKGRGNTHDAYF